MTSSPRPYPEERRLATVLFADVQGFTSLAERLDFEAASDLIKDVWQRLDSLIESHGGYIDKHIGDAVMAVWGAPHGGEDDAVRAVAAALALQSSLADFAAHSPREGASELKIRVGINTGPVMTGYAGLRGEYTVMGDTVNVASRLEHFAEPGAVIVSDSTYRLIRGAFRMHRLPPVQVKGRSEAIQIFEVEGPLAQPSRVRYRDAGGLETRLVAREAEMARLAELYRKSREAAQPVLVIVRGDAGIGKSRLLLEFTSQLETDEPALTFFSARCLAQTSRVPFYTWKSLWNTRFGLQDNDPPEQAREKFLRGAQALWGSEGGSALAEEAAHLIGHLAGIEWPDSRHLAEARNNPAAAVKRACEATRQLLCRISHNGPTVLFLDDLQWADGGSMDLLDYLLQSEIEPLPLLILAAARPGFLRYRRLLTHSAELITLKPLPLRADVVADAYPSIRSLPEPMLTELIQQADGNPYFLEEMVKSLRQSKKTGTERPSLAPAAEMPTSLRAMLQARLDTLSPEARSVALLASVVGRMFWVGAVLAAARVSVGSGLLARPAGEMERFIQAGLAELVRAELVFPRAGSAVAVEQEYIFKHSLLRDVAYGLLPRKHHKQYHLAVAKWLAKFAGAGFGAMVAEHLELAGEIQDAAKQYAEASEYARARGADEEGDWLDDHARELAAREKTA